MASSITRFDIKKFDGKNDFGLWQIKMCVVMVQQGCDDALETLPVYMEAGEKDTLMKKAYSTLILCLEDWVLREVTKETTAAGIWTKLTSLYMTKSLANRMYLKKKMYTYYMSPSTKLGDYIDEFNKLILDLENIDIEGHLKRDCPMKKSSGFVKKGKQDQDFDSSDDEVIDGGSVQLGETGHALSKGYGKWRYDCTLEKESYTVKMQIGRINVIKGCRVMMTGIRKNKCVYSLEAKVITFGVQKHGVSKEVGFKQVGIKQFGFKLLGIKQVGFKQLGPVAQRRLEDKQLKEKTNTDCTHGVSKEVGFKQVGIKQFGFKLLGIKQVGFKQLGPGVETGVHGVQDEKLAQRRLEDKQLKEKTNTDCTVNEQEKVHLGTKVGTNIMVTGVPGQEGAEGNAVEKKKVNESMKANLEKLLKYNAWST
nr:retrovirus-related Pol polyprotein from transposon TNT 1-94 [Tanacetum cinerariifolium]